MTSLEEINPGINSSRLSGSAQDGSPASAQDHLAAIMHRPCLREGIELHPFDTSAKEPVYLAHLPNGQRLQISAFLYVILSCLDGQHTLEELATEITASQELAISEKELAWVLREKIYPQGLLAGSNVPYPTPSKDISPLKMLVRIPLLPARWASFVTRPCQILFPTPTAVAVIGLIIFIHLLTYAELGQSINLLRPQAALATLIDNPVNLLLIFGLLMLSSWFHEFGHLAASGYFGCKHGPLGVGIYSFFRFVMYVEINDAWRLPRVQRVIIDLGGIYFQFIATIFFFLAYLRTGMSSFLWAIVFTDASLLGNLNPMFKFDGYWALSDLAGVPNLHRRVGDQLKRLLPGQKQSQNPFLQNQSLAGAVLWLYSIFFLLYFTYFAWLLLALLPGLIPLYPTLIQEVFAAASSALHQGDWRAAGEALLDLAMPTLLLVGLTFFAARGVRAVWGSRTKIAAFFSKSGEDADTPERPDV
jgi:putative peptide zinc metalloprotease protein